VVASADDLQNPTCCDDVLRERVLKLAMLIGGVNIMHGLGAISLAHTEAHLQRTLEAYDAFAKRLAVSR